MAQRRGGFCVNNEERFFLQCFKTPLTAAAISMMASVLWPLNAQVAIGFVLSHHGVHFMNVGKAAGLVLDHDQGHHIVDVGQSIGDQSGFGGIGFLG